MESSTVSIRWDVMKVAEILSNIINLNAKKNQSGGDSGNELWFEELNGYCDENLEEEVTEIEKQQ